MIAEDEDLFFEVIDLLHEKNKQLMRAQAEQSKAEVFLTSENLSWTCISPSYVESYVIPHLNDYADILHEYGKIYAVHMCGKLKLLEKQLKQGRFDAISDMSPGPAGDTQLWEGAKSYPHLALRGGIGCDVWTDPDPEACYHAAWEILEKCEGRRGIILGSGDSVPAGTTMAHMKAVTRAARDFEAGR